MVPSLGVAYFKTGMFQNTALMSIGCVKYDIFVLVLTYMGVHFGRVFSVNSVPGSSSMHSLTSSSSSVTLSTSSKSRTSIGVGVGFGVGFDFDFDFDGFAAFAAVADGGIVVIGFITESELFKNCCHSKSSSNANAIAIDCCLRC